eukprot:g4006.t1
MQSRRKVIPLACAGRKLTGPPEGYDCRKAAQVQQWLDQIPPSDLLEAETEQKSQTVESEKDLDRNSANAAHSEQEIMNRESKADAGTEKWQDSEEQEPSEDSALHQRQQTKRDRVVVEPTETSVLLEASQSPPEQHSLKSSVDTVNKDSTKSTKPQPRCWKCESLLEDLVRERIRNKELEALVSKQQMELDKSKQEIEKLGSCISEISLRFSQKLITEKESNQSLNSTLEKKQLQNEQLNKVRQIQLHLISAAVLREMRC